MSNIYGTHQFDIFINVIKNNDVVKNNDNIDDKLLVIIEYKNDEDFNIICNTIKNEKISKMKNGFYYINGNIIRYLPLDNILLMKNNIDEILSYCDSNKNHTKNDINTNIKNYTFKDFLINWVNYLSKNNTDFHTYFYSPRLLFSWNYGCFYGILKSKNQIDFLSFILVDNKNNKIKIQNQYFSIPKSIHFDKILGYFVYNTQKNDNNRDLDIKTDNNTELKTDNNKELKTDDNIDIKTDSNIDINAYIKTDSNIELKTDDNIDIKTNEYISKSYEDDKIHLVSELIIIVMWIYFRLKIIIQNTFFQSKNENNDKNKINNGNKIKFFQIDKAINIEEFILKNKGILKIIQDKKNSEIWINDKWIPSIEYLDNSNKSYYIQKYIKNSKSSKFFNIPYFFKNNIDNQTSVYFSKIIYIKNPDELTNFLESIKNNIILKNQLTTNYRLLYLSIPFLNKQILITDINDDIYNQIKIVLSL